MQVYLKYSLPSFSANNLRLSKNISNYSLNNLKSTVISPI